MPDKWKEFYSNKENLKKLILPAVVLILLVSFLLHLFTVNRNADVSAAQIRAAVKKVSDHDYSTVEKVQTQIRQVTRNQGSAQNVATLRARYQRAFQGSIVVGDSVTEGLSLYGYLSEDQVFSVVGASLLTDSLFQKAAAAKPKYAFFAFGMNDMGNFRGDADKFIKQYRKVLKKFEKASPKTKIYICTITKPTAGAMKLNKSITHYAEFNKALKKMCREDDLPVVNVTPILIEHPEFYAEDGIHANTTYYPYWIEKMIQEAGLE